MKKCNKFKVYKEIIKITHKSNKDYIKNIKKADSKDFTHTK